MPHTIMQAIRTLHNHSITKKVKLASVPATTSFTVTGFLSLMVNDPYYFEKPCSK